ncbi:MAG: dockerin type I domain-containing protein, partial [Planctomycetota bacterium]
PWKNWWAGRRRGPESTGYKFYSWDYENTIGNNRGRSPLSKNALQNNFSSAGEAHTRLRTNPEYRMRFGDRVHKFLFNGGILTPEKLIPRYQALSDRVERAIVGESARWGDQHHATPLTLREWTQERNWVLNTYLPARTNIVLGQFRGAGLYPSLDAPFFNRHGGLVPSGFRVVSRTRDGDVYFTTDGSDPRLPGGEISETAELFSSGTPIVLLPEDSELKYAVPTDGSLGLEWIQPDFDDSSWSAGQGAVGFDEGDGYDEYIDTDVMKLMHDQRTTIYLRYEFDADVDVSTLLFPTLRMRYDDGYVAYLNGVEVASDRAPDPEERSWESRASASRSDRLAVEYAGFDLEAHASLFRRGRNVLAIHALNARVTDADFLVQAQMTATEAQDAGVVVETSTRIRTRALVDDRWSALNEADFVVDTNIPLRVTEIMFHPPDSLVEGAFDADEYEFIEFQNVGSEPIDLADLRLSGGVQFDFSGSSVTTLEAGDYLVLVENLDAFAQRYDESTIQIGGEYSGKLENTGDHLKIEGFLGEPVLSFEFLDTWHPATDGDGRTLVVVDPFAPRDAWNDATQWSESETFGGTPGTGPSLAGAILPGDVNSDGSLNITDATQILRYLFVNEETNLPCSGKTAEDGGNEVAFDLDQDGEVQLNDAVVILAYLFQRGDSPALGTDCVATLGCPRVCA